MSPLDAKNASFLMGFIVFVSLRWDTASQHGKGRDISVTRLRYSTNHNTLDSWSISVHLAFWNNELCKNFQKGGAYRNTIIVHYVENKSFLFIFLS